jgi:hypothetical protein
MGDPTLQSRGLYLTTGHDVIVQFADVEHSTRRSVVIVLFGPDGLRTGEAAGSVDLYQRPYAFTS